MRPNGSYWVIVPIIFCMCLQIVKSQYQLPPISFPQPFSSPSSSSTSPSSSSSSSSQPSQQSSSSSSSSSSQPSQQSSSSSSSCVNRLLPCLKYLNSTRDPPDVCCDPLKSVIKSDPQCLCQMISTQGTFQAQLLGIDVSQVEMLPGRCGQHVNPIGCVTGSTRSGNSLQSSASERSFASLMIFFIEAILVIIFH